MNHPTTHGYDYGTGHRFKSFVWSKSMETCRASIWSYNHFHYLRRNLISKRKRTKCRGAIYGENIWNWKTSKARFILKRWCLTMLRGELYCFHSDSAPPLSDETRMWSVFRWPVESYAMRVKCSWSQFFFHFIEWHRSWDSILISIYLTDTHDLKNGNEKKKEKKNEFRSRPVFQERNFK